MQNQNAETNYSPNRSLPNAKRNRIPLRLLFKEVFDKVPLH
jgi:hypothetical protein